MSAACFTKMALNRGAHRLWASRNSWTPQRVGPWGLVVVQPALNIAHHDHAYIQRRSGPVLFSYTRPGSVSKYRRAAIERASVAWRAASAGDQRSPAPIVSIHIVAVRASLG